MTTLEDLARRLSTDPFFFAYRLRQWASWYELTDDALAAWIGCTRDKLTALRMCGTPTTEADVIHMASELGVSEARIAEIALGETDLIEQHAAEYPDRPAPPSLPY